VRRPELTFAVMDHSVSTKNRLLPVLDADARGQFEALERNCAESGVHLFDMHSKKPGHRAHHRPRAGNHTAGTKRIVCGDSHTSTHGAFGRWHSGLVPAKSSMCWRRNA